ncbi:MAG: hypothetical protein GY796_01085, partial [Chloroflexi bacterium]|nr:hypothetical protein [Chloroflexota bacterium]
SPPLELLHDDELAQVLGQALAKKPDERFNTTSEFVMALTAAVLSVTADANMTFIMGATRAVTDSEPEPAAASVELIITPEEDEPEEASDATLIAPSPLRPLPLTTDIESEEELHLDEAPDDVLIAYDSDATMIVAPPTAPKFPEESERPPVALSELVEDDPNLFDVEATVVVVSPKPEDENEPTANEDDLPNHDATYIAKPVPAETPVPVVPPEEDGWAPSDVNATFIVEPIPDKKPERSATAAVFKPSPPPPVRSRIDEASLNRDVVVKPGAGGQTPSGFRWPLKGWHTAVIFILIAIIALALFLGRGTADIFTAAESTATIMATVPGEKKKIRVLNAEADTVWQMGDKGGLLPEDGLLPWPNEDDSLVIIADDDAATLDMPDGTQFVLAPQTKLIFDLTAADTLLDYHLSYGRLLINTNKNQITLETPLGSTASMTNGLMGIGYSESPFLFDVDCFKGPCDVTDLDIIQTLSEGERSYIGGNGLASPEPVRNELYLFSDLVAEATVTPSSTPTRTALPTKEPTATLIATAADTSTPTPSATPTLTPTETAIFLPRPRIAQYSCSAPGTFTKNQNIQFAWTWRGQLRSGEYLEVRVGAQGATNLSSVGRASSEEKQGDLWVMTISAAQFFEDRFHDYEWQVVHMSSNGRTPIVFSSRGCLHITP